MLEFVPYLRPIEAYVSSTGLASWSSVPPASNSSPSYALRLRAPETVERKRKPHVSPHVCARATVRRARALWVARRGGKRWGGAEQFAMEIVAVDRRLGAGAPAESAAAAVRRRRRRDFASDQPRREQHASIGRGKRGIQDSFMKKVLRYSHVKVTRYILKDVHANGKPKIILKDVHANSKPFRQLWWGYKGSLFVSLYSNIIFLQFKITIFHNY